MLEEKFIKEVEELLIQIIEEQEKQGKLLEKHHKVSMKNFSKLREYNEIADMTNQVFEKRITHIEEILSKRAREN